MHSVTARYGLSRHFFTRPRQLRPFRRCTGAVLHQLSIVFLGCRGLPRHLRCSSSAIQSVEAIGVDLHRVLVLGECLLRMVGFEQNVRQHLARGNLHFSLAVFVLLVRNTAHDLRRIIVLLLSERDPCPNLVAAGVHVLGDIGVGTFFHLFHHRVIVRKVLLCCGRIAEVSATYRACPVDDGDILRLLWPSSDRVMQPSSNAASRSRRSQEIPPAPYRDIRAYRGLPSGPLSALW